LSSNSFYPKLNLKERVVKCGKIPSEILAEVFYNVKK
jgi:hypothetical protein